MKNNFLFWVFALFFLVQIPFIFSLDCNAISQINKPLCEELLKLNLTQQEKEILISNLEYNKTLFPDHNYIYDHNTNIQLTNPPNNTQIYNSIYITDAWISLLTIMPSVLYNNGLYVPKESKVLTAYDYSLQIPSNYESPRYPHTQEGYCKIKYSISQHIESLRVYVNSVQTGTGKLANALVNQDSKITSELVVYLELNTKKYEWERKCVGRDDGDCIEWDYDCELSINNNQNDMLILRDELEVKYYENTPSTTIELLDAYLDTSKFNLTKTNSVHLSFQDSKYEFNEFYYAINYSKEPYYIYTLIANDYNKESLDNLQKTDNFLFVNNINNCKITSFDFFNTIESSCSFFPQNISFYIKTDKLSYKSNQTIEVEIFPKNTFVNLTYGTQSKLAQNQATFKAQPLTNKIKAKYKTLEKEKIIYVQERSRFRIVWDLSLFGLFNYFLYGVLRKYLGGFL